MTQSQYDSLILFDSTLIIRRMSEPTQITPYPLRLSPELRTKLEEAAKQNARSLHSEIILRLDGSFQGDEIDHLAPEDLAAEIEATAQRMQKLMKKFRALQSGR